MRNLLLFVIRYHAFFIFVILEVIAFYVIIETGNKAQRNAWMSSANSVTGFFSKRYNNIVEYWNLPEQNEDLKVENARLKAQLKSSKFNHLADTIAVNDTLYEQQFTYIPAKVVNNSVNFQNNYLTLNRGARHGVKANMGVVTDKGLVGIVRKSTQNYASVLSLLNRDTRISAKIKRNNFFGSLVWEDKDPRYMTLNAIPKHVTIEESDTIITSGYSSIFPEGIIIGTVESHYQKPGSNFHTIKVLLTADLNQVNHVYVIKNLMVEEKQTLEETNKN